MPGLLLPATPTSASTQHCASCGSASASSPRARSASPATRVSASPELSSSCFSTWAQSAAAAGVGWDGSALHCFLPGLPPRAWAATAATAAQRRAKAALRRCSGTARGRGHVAAGAARGAPAHLLALALPPQLPHQRQLLLLEPERVAVAQEEGAAVQPGSQARPGRQRHA
jgi:hypothetical protein